MAKEEELTTTPTTSAGLWLHHFMVVRVMASIELAALARDDIFY